MRYADKISWRCTAPITEQPTLFPNSRNATSQSSATGTHSHEPPLLFPGSITTLSIVLSALPQEAAPLSRTTIPQRSGRRKPLASRISLQKELSKRNLARALELGLPTKTTNYRIERRQGRASPSPSPRWKPPLSNRISLSKRDIDL